MKRLWRILAAALAMLVAGGIAISEGPTPTTPALRRILSISLSVKPTELVAPGDVTLAFTITNTSEYNAENVFISADGLHPEPLGQIDAGDSQVFANRKHAVTQEKLDKGMLSFTLWHDGVAGDPDPVNYMVECPIEKAVAQPGVEFTRQFAGQFARMGDVATITYRVRNTGNVPLAGLRLSDALGDFSARADALEVGESRIFTSKVLISGNAVSKPKLTYAVPDQKNKEYAAQLSEARILLSSEQMEATLSLDRESAAYGESVIATLTIANFGNVDLYDISVYDEVLGGLVADGLELRNGAKPLTVRRTYPVRGDQEFQFLVRANSQSGARIEVPTEPVALTALAAAAGEVAVRAEAVYPTIAGGGNAPFDIYIENSGADIRQADLAETTTGNSLGELAVLPGNFTTVRRVYVPIAQSAELAFEISYLDGQGQRRVSLSAPAPIEIARGGHRLESDEEDEPYTGESVKLGQSPIFALMLAGAGVALVGLVVALLLSSRRAKRARRERLALKKRQLQEELGKTNRFTPVKRPERKRKENP